MNGREKSMDGRTIVEIHINPIAEIESLRAERDKLKAALEKARDELGVPQPGYPAPVANAVEIIREALGDK